MSNLTVLLSCMYQKDAKIIFQSNIQTDVIVVNQCDIDKIEIFDFTNKKGRICHAKFICTTSRGLSNSRNIAIDNAVNADVCYFCDDDEFLVDNYEDIILNAHNKYPDKAVITFSLIRKNYSYPTVEQSVKLKQILRTSSVQTTFKRIKILKHNIRFDPYMGSGSGNGGGEENKFLMDCKRAGLKLWYVPQIIAEVKSENSRWFNGFTEKYYRDMAWANRRILGNFLGFIYMVYWIIFRRKDFNQELSLKDIVRSSIQGYLEIR